VGDEVRHNRAAFPLMGTGNVPLTYVLNFLAEKGQRPLITLEPHQEGSLTTSLEYLSKIWPWE
jgi:hypothetical protein